MKEVAVRQRARGRNFDIGDYLIACIVLSRGASLAMRNVKEFDHLDIALLNLWTG